VDHFLIYASTLTTNYRTLCPFFFASGPLGCISDGRIGIYTAMAQMALLENADEHVG
jgi:hypothetical protein